MAHAMDLATQTATLRQFMEGAREKWGGVESWGAVGLCWGGKVVVLCSGEGGPFRASGQVHPGRLEGADARRLVPRFLLFSFLCGFSRLVWRGE